MAARSRRNTAASTYRTWENPLLAEGLRQIARSGKYGFHLDGRFRRARTRQAVMLQARRDQLG